MSENQCPFNHAAGGGMSNREWWPNRLRLEILRQHFSEFNPMEEAFNYAEELGFQTYQVLQKKFCDRCSVCRHMKMTCLSFR